MSNSILAPGTLLSPYLFSGGGDFIANLISIGGIEVPINCEGGTFSRPSSVFYADGPSTVVSSSLASQTVTLPVSFNFDINLYRNLIDGAEPDYVLSGTGVGIAEFQFFDTETFPNGAIELKFVRYTATTSAIPEPSSRLMLLLGLASMGVRSRRRCLEAA